MCVCLLIVFPYAAVSAAAGGVHSPVELRSCKKQLPRKKDQVFPASSGWSWTACKTGLVSLVTIFFPCLVSSSAARA